jgi:hypothetical protein
MRLCLLSTPSSGTDAALSFSLACFAVAEIPLDDVYERVEARISLHSNLSNSAVGFLSVLNQLGYVSTVFLNMERQVHYSAHQPGYIFGVLALLFFKLEHFFIELCLLIIEPRLLLDHKLDLALNIVAAHLSP